MLAALSDTYVRGTDPRSIELATFWGLALQDAVPDETKLGALPQAAARKVGCRTCAAVQRMLFYDVAVIATYPDGKLR